MGKQQRLLVGKQIREGSMSPAECMAKCKVRCTSVCSWRRQCEESSGLAKARPQAKPLGVSAAAPAGPDYEATESINGRAKAEMFADFRIGEPDDVPEAVADYIKLFSEARPMFCLGHMTPEQYREEPLKANPSPLPPDERPHLPAALPPKEDRAATIRNFMSTFR